MCRLFSLLLDELRSAPLPPGLNMPGNANMLRGKIYKGENYLGLPYVVLDCPAVLNRDDIFLFRAIFWWGNHFSFTLLLKGRPLAKFRQALLLKLPSLRNRKSGIYYCIHADDMWDHTFDRSNLRSLSSVSRLRRDAAQRNFIKLSRKLPVTDWKKAVRFGMESYLVFLAALTAEG